MAEAFVKDRDQFRCSVCLEPLKEPVTIPCGHSYCMSCIGGCWDQEEKKGEFSCPQCREKFTPRPALKKNTMLAELVDKIKCSGAQTGHEATPNAEPEVPCDFCSEGKVKAVKSCLLCQVSLCDTHLQPHNDIPALKKHKLVKAMQLEEVICSQHGSLLQVFCLTDQKCICMLCTMDDHKGHDTVSAAKQRMLSECQLLDMAIKYEEMIQEREKKLKDVREAVESRNSLAQKAEQHSEKVFTRLLKFIERRRVEVREQIRGQQKVAVSHAERVVEELEEEVAELRRGDAELEQLPHSDNNVHFLQIFHGLETSLDCEGLPSMNLSSETSFKGLQRALSALEKGVRNLCERDMKKKINKKLKNIKVVRPPVPKTRQGFLKYSRQLTLDPNTANSSISLSDDNRRATLQFREQQYPDHPDRFKSNRQVLCKEGLTGRCYWEVEFSSNDPDFSVDIAVVYKSIKREESDVDAKEDEVMEEDNSKIEDDDDDDDDDDDADMEEVVEDGGDGASPDDIADGKDAYRRRYPIEDDDDWDDDDDYYDDDDDYWDDDDDDDYYVDNDDDDDDDFNYTDPAVLSADSDDDDDGEDDNVCKVPCGFGRNEQSWSFQVTYDLLDEPLGCFYHTGKRTKDVLVPNSKIGVYLDHRQGILSFYSVSYTMTLLHTERTTFTEPLYPGFGLHEDCSVTLCL